MMQHRVSYLLLAIRECLVSDVCYSGQIWLVSPDLSSFEAMTGPLADISGVFLRAIYRCAAPRIASLSTLTSADRRN